MTLSLSDINQNIVLVDGGSSVQEVRNQVGDEIWAYIVAFHNGRFSLFQLVDLFDAVRDEFGDNVPDGGTRMPIHQLGDFLDTYAAKTVDMHGSTDLKKAQKLAAVQKKFKGVVVLDSQKDAGLLGYDNVVGVVVTKAQEGTRAARDVDESYVPTTGSGGTLSAGDAKESDPAPASDRPTEPRLVNVELMNEDYEKFNPNDKPLEVKKNYQLSFYIDSKVSKYNITTSSVELSGDIFEADKDEVGLTVQLESDDFEIDEKIQELAVPRTGKSGKVRFNIKPLADGPATVTAVFLKDGAFVQAMTLKFFVGALFKADTLGREIDAAPLIRPRDLSITILEAVGGYQMILSGPVGAMAKIPISKQHLHNMIAGIRRVLLKEAVYFEHNKVRLYQTRIDMPTGVRDHVLPILANAGYDLFDQLFYGPGHDMQANLLGDTFRKMARKDKLNIQIFAQDFTMPWGLLYVGDDPDHPDPEMFLGLKHIIEHIPLQPKMQVTEREIDTSSGFQIGLNVNRDIDKEMGSEIIGRQLTYWDEKGRKSAQIKVEVRDDAADVMEALNNGEVKDSVLYFYCHAESYNLAEQDKGGPDQSKMIMTGKQALTLRRMSRNKTSLPGKPLVFINACESAEMSPEFYDGFVPYFVNKGARGVIGTECETPALFAEEWAKRFFDRFLAGEQTLGEIFLDLRREFYFDHNNIMGLVYALYVDGDTRLSQPVLGA